MAEERNQIDHVLTRLSKIHRHLSLEPIKYEYDINLIDYQGVESKINARLKESQFCIFIFYSKIGEYTCQEIEYALENDIKIFTFFKKGFSPDFRQMRDYEKLLDFQASLNETILIQTFKTVDDFDHSLYETLNQYLLENYAITDIDKYDKTVKKLSESNQQLISLLAEKEAEIKNLKPKTTPDNYKLKELKNQIESIKRELLQSEEIIQQQAKEKAQLEKLLSTQRYHDPFRANAVEEIKKGNYSRAEEYLKHSAKDNIADTADTFFQLGKIKKFKGQYEEAMDYFELAIKIDAENSTYYYEAGQLAVDIGNIDKGISLLEKALEFNVKIYGKDHKQIANNYKSLGSAYLRKGEFKKAIENYEKAKKINLHDEDISEAAIEDDKDIGTAYIQEGEYDKALFFLESSLSLQVKLKGENHPDTADIFIKIGDVYRNKKDYNKALNYLLKAKKINSQFLSSNHPNLVNTDIGLAMIYNDIGEYSKAVELFKEALFVQPENTWIETQLKIAKARLGANITDGVISFLQETLKNSGKEKQKIIDKALDVVESVNNIRGHASQFTSGNVVHYTKLKTADILTAEKPEKSFLRYYNVVYMNDPEEGNILLNNLIDKNIKSAFISGEKKQENNAYLGSFLPAKDHDDELVMWRTYGKDENNMEAGGCSLIITGEFFDKDRLYGQSELRSELPKSIGGHTLYRVIYFDKHSKKIINDKGNKVKKDLFLLKKNLNTLITFKDKKNIKNPLNEAIDKVIYRLLSELRYFFKSADYAFENELRVIQYVQPESEQVNIDDKNGIPRKLYINSNKPLHPYLKEIVLGPKVPNPSYWSYLEAMLKKNGYNIRVRQSECEFR